MQQVSESYRTEQRQPIAGAMQARIIFGLIDVDAAVSATVVGSGGECYSTAATIVYEEAVPERVYATAEPSRMRADGKQLILPRDPAKMQSEGYVSQQISDGEGRFSAPPAIDISFDRQHSVAALTFTFDRASGDYPSQMRVVAWQQERLLVDKLVSPTAADYIVEGAIEGFDRLAITMLATSKPYRRARVQQLQFGISMTLEGGVIQSMTQKREVDPISRRLPQSSLAFSLVNTNTATGDSTNLYDPDNPQGVWRFMEQRNPIRAQYGQVITHDGSNRVEWLPAGRYYLNAAPTVSGLYAKFTAYDVMELLKGSYSRGVYDGAPHSLWELATDVLTSAGLPLTAPNKPLWRLWEGLRELTTTAPLPQRSCRELLQLIAHAACCTLGCDRDGMVSIFPAPAEQQSLVIDYSSMTGQPKATKIPTLYRVDCPVYSYATEGNSHELHKGEYAVNGEGEVKVSFGQSLVDSVTVTGATVVAQQWYTQSVELTLGGSGTATVVVTGRTLTASRSSVSSVVAGADINGAVEQLDNPLITTPTQAQQVADWVRDYLEYRTSYEFTSRGNPECDPLDIVKLESAFDREFPAVVLKNEVTFAGSLKGKMTCKRRVKGDV